MLLKETTLRIYRHTGKKSEDGKKDIREPFGNADGEDGKGEKIRVVKANFLVPTIEEFAEYCGGEDKVQRGLALVAEEFATAKGRTKTQGITPADFYNKGESFQQDIVKQIVSTIEGYTLAQDLLDEVDKTTKVQVADKFGALDINDPDFTAKFLALQASIK